MGNFFEKMRQKSVNEASEKRQRDAVWEIVLGNQKER